MDGVEFALKQPSDWRTSSSSIQRSWLILMATEALDYLPTFYKLKETTLVLTCTREQTKLEVSFSTPTGLVVELTQLQVPTTYNLIIQIDYIKKGSVSHRTLFL